MGNEDLGIMTRNIIWYARTQLFIRKASFRMPHKRLAPQRLLRGKSFVTLLASSIKVESDVMLSVAKRTYILYLGDVSSGMFWA